MRQLSFIILFLTLAAGCANPNKEVACESSVHKATSGAGNIDESLINDSTVYAVKVKVGNPPRIIDMVADTGSSDFLVIGADCEGDGCKNAQNFAGTYNPSKSTTKDGPIGSNTPSYGTGHGIKTEVYRDQVALSCGAPIKGVTIQDVVNANQLGHSIMGLAYPNLASRNPDGGSYGQTYIELLEGKNPTFTLTPCGQGGESAVIFGGGDPRIANSDPTRRVVPVFLPPSGPTGFYNLGPMNISVNGESMGDQVPNQENGEPYAIADSGTTLWILPKSNVDAIKTVLIQKAKDLGLDDLADNDAFWSTNPRRSSNVKADISLATLKKFPSITVSLEDINGRTVELIARPEKYFRSAGGNSRYFGLQESGENGPIIFGLAFLESFSIEFDRSKGGPKAPQAGGDTMSFVSNDKICDMKVE